MSTHAIEIVEIGKIDPHPNADLLEICHIRGWQCIIQKNQFSSGDRAIYIPPDYEVPVSHPLFKFLDSGREYERIRVRKFRGLISQGLLVQVPYELADRKTGENIMDDLGVRRYEPPMPRGACNFVPPPPYVYTSKFDVESFERYPDIIQPGELVTITEKIHGANARFCFTKNRDENYEQFVGTRNNWCKEEEGNIWWMAFHKYPGLKTICQANPDLVLYGEVFGQVQDLKYGAKRDEVFFAAFAGRLATRWVPGEILRELCKLNHVPVAPVLYEGPFDIAIARELAEQNSIWATADHMREGVVIVPKEEREHPEIGRVALKPISNRYMMKG